MENRNDARNITLSDLWGIFVDRIWIIVLCAAIVTIGLWVGDKMLTTPEYESTATLYILRQNDESVASDVSSDFSLALKVVNDCTYMLKSHTVLDSVIEQLDLDMEYKELYNRISTSNPSDTRILEVSVTHTDQQEAKRIVDALCEVGTLKICDAMGFEQVNLYEYGTLSYEQSNGLGLTTCVLGGIITVMLVYGIFLIAYFVDDRIHDREDVERYLGLSLLGDIPTVGEGDKKGTYGYGRKPKKRKR